MALSSPQNPLLKNVRQAAESGRPLDDGTLVAEGPHLVAEALRSQWAVRRILATPESWQRFPDLAARCRGIEVVEVAAQAFQTIAATEHTQGILALVEPRKWDWPDLLESGGPLVILDGIQDPGNAGTIVRSAEAFGAGGVVLMEGTVKIGNTKFLRAASGSLFRVPFVQGVSVSQVLGVARQSGIMLYALAANGQIGLQSETLGSRIGFIVGSEGAGVRADFVPHVKLLSIPTVGVESLNAGVACSIALYESARQRQGR